ncbi:hypothetical protein MCEREM30_03445 [Paracoccaceae bacterium]
MLQTAFLPDMAAAQSINFIHTGGEIDVRSITQANNAGHKIYGLTSGGRASVNTAASFTGNFSSLVISQTGSAAQTFGAKLEVSNTANVGFYMNTSSASSMLVNVKAGTYTSDVRISGSGKKAIDIVVNALNKTVVQDIDVTGGAVNLRVNQTNSATLILDHTALGTFRDTLEINQSGIDTIANITSTSEGSSTLMMRLAGDDSEAYVNAQLGFGSYLNYEVFRDDVTLGSENSPVNIIVSDNSRVTITVND